MDDLNRADGLRLQQLARRIGVRWAYGPWPGFLPGVGHLADRVEDLAHEMGHWVAAPPSRRMKKHFGLGSPAGEGGEVSARTALDEEERASLLGIEFLVRVESPPDAVNGVFMDHSWLDGTTEPQRVIADLTRLGLLPLRRVRPLLRAYKRALEAYR
jgi:hypothetical protein